MTTFWLFVGMGLIVGILAFLAVWAFLAGGTSGLFGEDGDDGEDYPISRHRKGEWDE